MHAASLDGATGASDMDHQALEAFRVASPDGSVRRVLYMSGYLGAHAGGDRVLDETARLPLIQQWRVAARGDRA